MKLTLLALLSVLSLAKAANPGLVLESANSLIFQLRDLEPFSTIEQASGYIPEYGLQINALLRKSEVTPFDVRLLIEALKLLAGDWAQSVEGLDDGDWVSISAHVLGPPFSYITVRSKPSVNNSTEVWVGDVRQPEYE